MILESLHFWRSRWYSEINFRLVLDTRYCGEPFYCQTVDLLRVSKFRVNLWISYFFDDITTFLGTEKPLIRWRNLYFLKGNRLFLCRSLQFQRFRACQNDKYPRFKSKPAAPSVRAWGSSCRIGRRFHQLRMPDFLSTPRYTPGRCAETQTAVLVKAAGICLVCQSLAPSLVF